MPEIDRSATSTDRQWEADATLTVRLRPEDLCGLHALATLDGVTTGDAGGFTETLARVLRSGLAADLDRAGLPWNPTADDLAAAVKLEQDAGMLPATATRVELPAAAAHGALRKRRLWWLLAAGVGIFLAVAMVGSYAAGWAWTGFRTNDQVWDWLNLLLLPAAFAMVPLWLRHGDEIDPRHKSLLAAVVVAFGLLVVAGYVTPLLWTGFPSQTLWNWLTLVVLPVTLTTAQTWPTSARRVRRVHVVAGTSFLAGWAVTMVGGYAFGWQWTGYQGNTLWDWLRLLLAPLVIDTVVVPALIRLASGDAARRADERAREAAHQRLLEAARQRAGVDAGGEAGAIRAGGAPVG